MSPVGFDTLQVLVILLPGFVTARIVQTLTVRSRQTEFDKVIEAFLYSFIVYVIFAVLFPQLVLTDRKGIVVLALIAIILGLLVSALITNDLPTRFLRWVKVTTKSTRSSVWSDVFHDITQYALVEFKDGRRLIGWPRYFSDTPEEASVFLENAAWVLDDGSSVQIEGPGILNY